MRPLDSVRRAAEVGLGASAGRPHFGDSISHMKVHRLSNFSFCSKGVSSSRIQRGSRRAARGRRGAGARGIGAALRHLSLRFKAALSADSAGGEMSSGRGGRAEASPLTRCAAERDSTGPPGDDPFHNMEDYNENNIKVLCLGPKGSGKTTLLKKLQDVEEIDNTYSPVPTVGTNIFNVRYQNKAGRKQTLLVREIGGDMASLWTNYLDGIEKVLFVVDTSNLCQISAAAVLLYTLLADPRLQHAKFIVVLSKMDAAYRQMRNEALLMLQMTRLRKELRGREPPPPAVLEASALSGAGVDTLLKHLTAPSQKKNVTIT